MKTRLYQRICDSKNWYKEYQRKLQDLLREVLNGSIIFEGFERNYICCHTEWHSFMCQSRFPRGVTIGIVIEKKLSKTRIEPQNPAHSWRASGTDFSMQIFLVFFNFSRPTKGYWLCYIIFLEFKIGGELQFDWHEKNIVPAIQRTTCLVIAFQPENVPIVD